VSGHASRVQLHRAVWVCAYQRRSGIAVSIKVERSYPHAVSVKIERSYPHADGELHIRSYVECFQESYRESDWNRDTHDLSYMFPRTLFC
jgi:hypothetical protein